MKTLVANGNIIPSSIVILDSTNAGYGLQASSATTTPLFGICYQNQWRTPWAPLQDGFAAIQGINIGIFEEAEICRLQIGGTVTTGDMLTSDANGRGITTTTSGNYTIAQAMESGVNLDYILVRVLPAGVSVP
jgi:hypothetical protein